MGCSSLGFSMCHGVNPSLGLGFMGWETWNAREGPLLAFSCETYGGSAQPLGVRQGCLKGRGALSSGALRSILSRTPKGSHSETCFPPAVSRRSACVSTAHGASSGQGRKHSQTRRCAAPAGGSSLGLQSIICHCKNKFKKKKSLVPTCLLFHVLSSLYPNVDGVYMKMSSLSLSMCHKNVWVDTYTCMQMINLIMV